MRSGNETKHSMALASTRPQARPDAPLSGLVGHTPPSAPRGTATDYGTNQSEQHIVGFTFCHDTQIIALFPGLSTIHFLIACSLQKRS